MANSNFIVQNGISIGGSAGATITADPTTGAVAIAPAATASVPNPTATVFTTAGTVTSVATTGGVANVIDLATASNTSTASGATTFANITMTGNLASNSTGYFTIPAGTSSQRPASPAVGMMRYNSTITSFEGYYAGAWSSLGGVKSVDGKSYITAEASAGAGDDVIRVYAGDSGTSTQVMWASTSNINIRPTTAATSTTTGALQVAGGASIAGNLYVGGNVVVTNLITVNQEVVTTTEVIQGNIVAAATTVSTDVNTGALVVKGGAGIAGAIYAGSLNTGSGSITTTGTVSATTLTGTLSTASQPNITTLAGVTSIGASGSTTLTGTLSTASQPNITTLAGVTSIGASGSTTLTGTLQTASQPNITTLAGVTSIGASGSTTLTGTLQTAAQTNVTSVGTLTGLTVSGTIAASTNNTINIGSAGAVFATVYATTFSGVSTTAKYADLAENYQADAVYTPGQVVMFGGTQEVTIASADATAVAGVVSTNPAHLMNGGLNGPNVVAVALQGRVPCNVIGPTRKGDLLVSAGFGYARVNNSPAVGTVIGKALVDFTGVKGVIEVVVGRT